MVPNNGAAAVGSANSEKSLANSEKSRPLLNTSDAAVGSANSEKFLANSEKQEAVYSVRCTLLLGTLG